MAFVTLRSAIDAEDIVAFCNEHFIKYKQPAQVIVLPEMPLSPAGKVDRIALGATLVDSAET
jgi:long-chain acyl-CoA synthetase